MPKPSHYLSNKNLLIQIAKSKNSYCWFADPAFVGPTIYADTLDGPFEEGAIVRVITYDHVPASDVKHRSRAEGAQGRAAVNFPPFKQYHVRGGELVEVGRSHWRGDLETGHFSADHGRLTNNLATALMLIPERYSRKANWVGYTYRDEMAADALVHLVRVALRFNEARSNNPFAFYTTTIGNEFRRTLRAEKREQSIRDDLLIIAGKMPSMTRQIEMENPAYQHGMTVHTRKKRNPYRPRAPKTDAGAQIAA